MGKICLAEEDCSYINSHHPAKGKRKLSDMLHLQSTRICKSTTYHLPPLEDSILKMCREDEARVPSFWTVAALDVELLRWRSLFPSIAMDHFSLDTRSQKLIELGEAGFYASSSQRPQPLCLFLFALNLQSFLVTLEFGLYQEASSAIQLCELGD